MKSLIICIGHPIFSGDKLERNEMGGACSMYGSEERRMHGFGEGNLRERDHLEDPGVDGRIIIRHIFRQWDVRAWTGLISLGIGQVAATCECGNEPSGSIKCWESCD